MTPSILLPCLGQTTKCTPSHFKTRAKAWGGAEGGRGHASHPVFYLKKSKHACIKVENRNSSLRAFRNNDVSAAE